ncbi:NAD(P)/FAD-dependent oxidoreductase [Actinomadura sp. ATCC 31491]|uniref:NAD(P)/FAD-dependent oxidoreductase n=1 Tax=Actinomadura luzonensis TaxID=2805427 RepID=A0ABT0FX81_9ACTN|nr:FAD/NAD(P)-binding oxidoreductase [Actinomadura luzonensis]MCK2216957.1 NAD(P)/FAD-dependent oxidoreductase [Actinomadura luzonensis]
MRKRIVILGAGTGGTLVANRLRRLHPEDSAEIVVIDQDDEHVYQPGLLFLPFGPAEAGDLVRSRHGRLRRGVEFRQAPIDRVETGAQRVVLGDGRTVGYDVLVIATGAVLLPEETEGLTGPGWGEKVCTFYDLQGALALRAALARFAGGRLVVAVVDMPIKCPVAPLEFAFLADWHLRRRGLRERVELTYVTPLDAAFTRPVAAGALAGLLADKGVGLVTEFGTAAVDGPGGRLVSYDEREVGFDLAVVVPAHGGAAYVGRSPGLGDELNFVPVDRHTLQAAAAPDVFALGDAAGVPTSKAGSVAHFEGAAVVENVTRVLAGRPPAARFDGHANCFVETGHGKALLLDFNYDTEPLPGRYPWAAAGLPLLKQSRLNHLGKRAFPWLYWHALLPGRDLPGIGADMPVHGKKGR